MSKYLLLGFILLCLFNITAYANPDTSRSKSAYKEEAGLGIGAIIGGLIAGPPGAVIGAAGGAWFGNKESKEDNKITSLEKRLLEKQGELSYLQNQFSVLQSQYGQELQKVKLQRKLSELEELSRGVSLTVYFRTNSADVSPEIIPQIKKLATYLTSFPEIKLRIEGHADRRGSDKFNKALSKRRVDTVQNILVSAGINKKQIRTSHFGETQALASEGDMEGYIFDRRVSIHLSIDTEV